ncbi:MAG TPA: alpha/beta fold hydrolase [Solirubrobacter sp.]|nr:alpha/beta fold hydrolase [Solirubrobacter sp.]
MSPPPDWPGVEHRYHDLATGVRAHVAHAGPEDGPPVVALHGFPQHWYAWRRVIDALPEYRILAMDTRGLGWSGPAPDGDYRKARIADDAVALLDVLEIDRALLLGHDWGGWAGFIAIDLAPDRWTGYVATGTPHPWQSRRAMLRTAPRTLYQPPIAAPVLGPQLIARLVPTVLRVGWGERSTYDDAAEEIYAATYREPSRAEAASRYYRDFLTREMLRGTPRRPTVPTKLLYGTREPLGRAGAEGFENVEFLEGCGHFVPEERPEAVAAAVRAMP